MKSHEYFESYTNIAYFLSGIAVLIFGYEEVLEKRLLYAIGPAALACGSFVYHWVKTKPIYLFDWWAMMFCLSMITGSICDTESVWYAVLGWMLIYSLFIMDKIKIHDKYNVFIEVGLSMIPCLIAIYLHRSHLTFGIITVLLFIAIWIRSKDPDPRQARFYDSWQHGVWHILTAIDLGLPAFLP